MTVENGQLSHLLKARFSSRRNRIVDFLVSLPTVSLLLQRCHWRRFGCGLDWRETGSLDMIVPCMYDPQEYDECNVVLQHASMRLCFEPDRTSLVLNRVTRFESPEKCNAKDIVIWQWMIRDRRNYDLRTPYIHDRRHGLRCTITGQVLVVCITLYQWQ